MGLLRSAPTVAIESLGNAPSRAHTPLCWGTGGCMKKNAESRCGDVSTPYAPRMKARPVAPLFMLAFACFFALPDNSRAQVTAADQFALVMIYYNCPNPGACDEGAPTASSLAAVSGDGLVFWMSYNPTDSLPAWSPDGRRMAFGRDGEIMVVDVAGGIPINLTTHPADEAGATWAPDGSKIAFASNRDGRTEIYVMNADGTDTVRLTNSTAVLGSPAWSPDGTRIAFDCTVE